MIKYISKKFKFNINKINKKFIKFNNKNKKLFKIICK